MYEKGKEKIEIITGKSAVLRSSWEKQARFSCSSLVGGRVPAMVVGWGVHGRGGVVSGISGWEKFSRRSLCNYRHGRGI